MKWGSGWEVSANRDVYLQQRARQFADELRFRHGPVSDCDRQREEYLRQRCTVRQWSRRWPVRELLAAVGFDYQL